MHSQERTPNAARPARPSRLPLHPLMVGLGLCIGLSAPAVAQNYPAKAVTLVVPFAAGAETEQTLRARWFAGRGLIELVEEDDLSAGSLAAAIDRAAVRPRPEKGAIALDGAQRTAALISGWAAELKW